MRNAQKKPIFRLAVSTCPYSLSEIAVPRKLLATKYLKWRAQFFLEVWSVAKSCKQIAFLANTGLM